MNESLFINLLARNSFSNKKRMISGTTRQANKTIGCRFNNTYTYSNSAWSYSGGQNITATSDSTGYYEIEIPDSLVITNFTFDSSFGAPQDNPDQIETINLAYIGNVDSVEMLLFAFSNLTHVTFITGFNKFKNCPLKTMEGCFRACEKLESLDFTGLNTDYMIRNDSATDGRQRYGFPNCFYDCISLRHLILPKIPPTCYMGNGTFYGCDNLTSIECSGTISNDLMPVTQTSQSVITSGSPLTVASMRDILSHLSDIYAHECRFGDSAWYLASNDSQCQSYISTARTNGWTFVPTYNIYYYDDCKTQSKFNTASDGYYLVGTEASTDTYPCDIELGQVYAMCNEPSSAGSGQHGHLEYRFGSGIDFTNITTLDIKAKVFNYTNTSSTTGLMRNGYNTRSATTTQITTYNNNLILYVQLVDGNGNVTTYKEDDANHTFNPEKYNDSPQTEDSVTYTLSLPSSGFDKTNVVGINFMYMKENASSSSSGRKKGVWYKSIILK